MQLRKVARKKAKLKVGVSGASGFGKTFSALLLASGICEDWGKIAVIDSENGSADLYENLGDYQVLTLSPPFSPERYIEAIQACINAGMEVIIIDSITHEWSGVGGCLDIVESLGGGFTQWAKVTPRHQRFIDAILSADAHIITTVRRKQEYEMTKDQNGRNRVEKKGMKEITREGFEYELTLNFEIVNENHLVVASKDRTGLFDGRPEFVITAETGKELAAWANKGIDEVSQMEKDFAAAKSSEEVTDVGKRYKHLKANPRYMQAGSEARERVTTPKQQAS